MENPVPSETQLTIGLVVHWEAAPTDEDSEAWRR